ncbi:MAG: PTS sugar transporter subunit IIA [Thermodesulfobacteriota bacterium]|nr:PTS sugar transporter subunit IIA [Thermodesulfobacteriota bacterium]
MNIQDMLKKEFIIENLKSRTKKEVLVELSDVFSHGNTDIDRNAVIEVLMEREKLGSTGIGDGIAIPHGKLAGLEKLIISFGKSAMGVDFDSLDGKPVHIFFLLLAPENSAGQHLKALARISRMLKDVSFRESLLKAETSEDAYNLIVEKDGAYI